MIPILYFLLIPMYLQYKVDLIGTDGNSIRIHRVAVGNMNSTCTDFAGDFRVDPLFFLPVYGGILPTTIHVLSREKTLVDVHIPQNAFWMHKEVVLAFNGTMCMDEELQTNTRELVADLSSQQGLDDLVVNIRLKAPLTTFGILAYPALPLHRDLKLGSVKTTASQFIDIATSTANSNLILVGPASDNDAALRSSFSVDDIFKVAGVSIVWDELNFKMDDTSASIELGLAFQNPTPIELALIDGIEYYLEIENIKVIKMSIQHLALAPLLNSDFKVVVKATFLDDQINPDQVINAIEQATRKDFSFALVGPINVTQADFISHITRDLNVQGHFSDLLRLIPPSIMDQINNPETLHKLISTAESILGQSKISLFATNNQIKSSLELNLPGMDYIIPPKSFSFPYASSISVYGQQGKKAIESFAEPIIVSRKTGGGFFIGMEANVSPVNNMEAANDLAAGINPILAASPTNGSIGLKDLAFFPPNGSHFKWCDELFGKRIVSLGLPPLNKSFIISSASSFAPGLLKDLSKLVSINNVKVAQLSDRPGFGLDGNVQVNYPQGAPEVHVNVGFFSTSTTVENTPLLELQLPKGLQFSPSEQGVVLNGAGIVARNDQIGPVSQKIVNAIVKDGAPPSFVGITGLLYGDSSAQNVVTFSKIAVELDTGLIKDLANQAINQTHISSDDIAKLLPPGLVKVQGADLNVASANLVSVKSQTVLNNPVKISASLGSLSLDAMLNGQRGSGLVVDPISIQPGSSPLDLGMSLKPSTGANGLSQSVANFANDVLAFNEQSQALVGVTGITLSPSNPANPAAVIDQFQSVKIDVEAGKVFHLVNTLKASMPVIDITSSSSPIDISALLPHADIVNQLNPKIGFVKLNALSGSGLSTGADVSYTNPLPLSLNVPFSQASIDLNKQRFVDTSISGLTLTRSAGSMKLRPDMTFHNSAEMPDTVATLAKDFLAGNMNTNIGVGSIYFGTSATDKNDLFSLLNVDITRFIQPFAHYGKDVAASLQKIAPLSVEHLYKRQMEQSHSSMVELVGPMGIKVAVQNVDVKFLESKQIDSGIGGSLNLPFPVDINVPYFGASINLDELQGFSIATGMNLQGANPAMKLNALVSVNDVDELADKVQALSSALLNDQRLPGHVVAGHMIIGVSAQDSITAFSKIGASLGIDDVVSPMKSKLQLPAIDLNSLGVSVANLELDAKPSKTLSTGFTVNFNNPFHVTVSGLNYVSSSAGLDGHSVVDIESPGFGAVSSGANSLSVKADLKFSSEDASKRAVGDFATDISRNFGNTQAKFTVSKTLFGTDQKNAFRFLSKATVGLKSSMIVNQKSLDIAMDQVQKMNMTAESIIKMVKPQGLDVKINPSSKIDAKAKMDLTLPFAVKLNMPYFSVGNNLNSHPLMNLGITGLKLVTADSKSLSIGAQVEMLDSNEVEDAVAEVAAAASKDINNIAGSIGARDLVFGYDNSPANVIDTFSLANVEIQINTITKPLSGIIKQTISSVNVTETFHGLNLSLKNLNAETLPGRVMSTDFTAGFNLSFPISVQGLGYMAASGGIDESKVFSLTSEGLGISPGSNSVNLSSKITFPRVDGTPETVGLFVDDVMKNPGQTKQTLFVNGASFGYDEQHAIKTFSKALIRIPSSSILNNDTITMAKSLLNSIDFKSISNDLTLSKVHLNADEDGLFKTEISGGLNNISLTAKATIGYAHMATTLDNNSLLEVSVTKPLKIQTENNKLALDLVSEIKFQNSEPAQNAVASLVKSAISQASIQTVAGVADLRFGSDNSPDNIIDTFSKVSVSIGIAPFVPQLKEMTSKLINSTSGIMSSPATGPLKDVNVTISNVDMDVFDEETLVSNVEAFVSGLPFDLQVSVPYSYAGVQFNGKDFVANTIKNLAFKDGKLSTQILIYIPDNQPALQKVMDIAGNILFHRFVPVNDTIALHSLGFGFSQQQSAQTFSKVIAEVNIGSIVDKAIASVNASRPIEILNIDGRAAAAGIDADVIFSMSAPFFKLLAKTEGQARYQLNSSLPQVVACKVPIHSFRLPLVQLTLEPVVTPVGSGGTIDALAQAAVPLLTFQEFATYATLGYATLTGTNGKVFKKMSQVGFNAGELVLFNPIVMNLVPTWPWSPSHPFSLQMPVKVVVSFPNMGYLHLDVGRLEAGITMGGSTLLSAYSKGNIVILNNHEGANQTDIRKFKTMATIDIGIPLNDLNPITIFKIFQTLAQGKGVVPDLKVFQGDVELTYFPIIVNGLGQAGVIQDLVPFIGTVLGHLRPEIGGINPNNIPVIGPILKAIEKKIMGWLPDAHSSASQTLSLGSDNSSFNTSSTVIDSKHIIVISH